MKTKWWTVVPALQPSRLRPLRERLSEKVYATIPKGSLGGFEFTLLQTDKFERIAREAMEVCLRVLKESSKSRLDSYSVREQCIDRIPYYLSGLSRVLFSYNLSRNSCTRPGSLFWPKRKAIRTKFLFWRFRRIQHVGRRKVAPLYCSHYMIAYLLCVKKADDTRRLGFQAKHRCCDFNLISDTTKILLQHRSSVVSMLYHMNHVCWLRHYSTGFHTFC